MYKYEYIALLDIDEAIVPLGNTSNWSELMEEVGKENFTLKSDTIAAYHFRNIYFVAEFTDYHLKKTGVNILKPRIIYLNRKALVSTSHHGQFGL